MPPPRKRYKTKPTFRRNLSKNDSDVSDSVSDSNLHKKRTSHKGTKIDQASKWDEGALKNIGVYYERSGVSDFTKVLDTCPLVCARLPPGLNEFVNILTDCVDFDLKLDDVESGEIEGVDGNITTKEIQESLESALVKLNTILKKINLKDEDALSLRNERKVCTIHYAKKFVRDVLNHVLYLRRDAQHFVETAFYTTMISHCGGMCNLDPQVGLYLYKHSIDISGEMVSSTPDVTFLYTGGTDDTCLTVSVFEVNKASRKEGDDKQGQMSTMSSDSSSSMDENITAFHIHDFVGKDVLGRHGIELLVESLQLAKKDKTKHTTHMFGMIVVGFQVVLTCLYITDGEIRQICSGGCIVGAKRRIQYSKPLNILSSSDRRQFYEILFRLAEKL